MAELVRPEQQIVTPRSGTETTKLFAGPGGGVGSRLLH
jgi:hypothetical protein